MNFFKNRKSVVVLFIVGFWATYSVTTVSLFLNDLEELFIADQKRRVLQIQYQSDLAISFLLQDQDPALKELLKEAMDLDQFDFAILMDPQAPPFTLSRGGAVELAESYAPTEGVQQYGQYLYRTVKIKEKTLTLGSFHDKSLFIKSQLKFYAWKIIFDILVITALAGALIFFVLRDMIQLSKLLKGSAKRDLNSIQPRSSEAQVLLSATESFEKLSQDLAKESQMFSSSLGSAITTELRRGTKAPSSFPAVLVRVDLNSYTQKYLSTDLQQMTVSLNLYFAAAREIIERHQGLIYEYIGDEIVFFFKQSGSHEQTLLRAANCVRDLFAEISSLSLPEFTLKASLCSGTLNFVKLDQGPAFSGVPLIQSARMLNYISNKKVSSLIVLSADLSVLRDLVDQQNTISGELKGFEGQFQLSEISAFRPMVSANPFSYRASQDLVQAFHQLAQFFSERNQNKSQILLNELRQVHIQSQGQSIGTAYVQVLKLIISNPFDLKMLSLMVSLSKNFVPLKDYNVELKGLLHQVEEMADPRTKANALLSRAHFESDLNINMDQIDKSSNRLLADTLFVLGRKAVDERLIREIEAMVAHRDPVFRSSGLYLASALLKFHQEQDVVYFKTNPCFEALKQILKKSLEWNDPHLTKHALAYQEISGVRL